MSNIRHGALYRANVGLPLGVERDEDGRVWCQLFPLGEWHRADFPNGKLKLTPELLDQFINNWKAGGSPALPVDYNHDEEGPAAGWIEALRLSPDGVLEAAIKWTDAAAEDIKQDKRRYLSPTWAMKHANRRTGELGGPWLYGAALTNTPYYDSMPRVAASDSSETTQPLPPALKAKEQQMDKKRICAALGLPEDTDDEKVMEAIEAYAKAKAEAAPLDDEKEEEEKKEASAKASKLRAALEASTTETAKLAARVASLEADKAAMVEAAFERDFADVMKASKAGLATMKDTLHATAKAIGLDAVKSIVAALPDVPTSEMGVSGKADEASGDVNARIEALVVEKMKAGMKAQDAYAAVMREHRDLAEKALLPSGDNSNQASA